MDKDFLYIDDRKFHIEINMNTVEAWESMSGKTLMQFEADAAKSSGKGGVGFLDMLTWLYCSVKEGEEIEGRAFEHDFASFKRMCKPAILVRFSPIFVRQYMAYPKNSPTEVIKKKKSFREKLIFLFKF
jgi:hypothetical protein